MRGVRLGLGVAGLLLAGSTAAVAEPVIIKCKRPCTAVVQAIESNGGVVRYRYKYVDAIAAEVARPALRAVRSLVEPGAVRKDFVVAAPPIAARSGRHGHVDRGRVGIGRPARRRRDPRAGRRRAKRLPDQRRHPEPGTAVRRERVRPGREGGAHRFRHPAGLSAHLARRLGHRRRGPRRRRPGIQQRRQQRTRDVHGRDGFGQRGVHRRGPPAGHGRDPLSVVPRPGSEQSRR